MWITNGPTSIVPVCGDGIEATITGRDSAVFGVLLRARQKVSTAPRCELALVRAREQVQLEEDSKREICGAATLEQLDRRVEVDVVPRSQPIGRT